MRIQLVLWFIAYTVDSDVNTCCAGAGKSSTCNTLAGRTHTQFKLSNTLTSVTTAVSYRDYSFVSLPWRVVDTPGLFDTNKSDEAIREEVRGIAAVAPHGIAAFVLVVPRGRFTSEQEHAIRSLIDMFGEGVKRHLCIAVTGACEETSERSLMTRDVMLGEISGLPLHHYFRQFVEEIDYRVLPVENRMDPQRQVSRLTLHQRVLDILDSNQHRRYDASTLGVDVAGISGGGSSPLEAALRDTHIKNCTHRVHRRPVDKRLVLTLECELQD